MKMRIFRCIALFLFFCAISPQIHAQSQSLDQSGSLQQSSLPDCTDSLTATSADCVQSREQTLQLSTGETGTATPRRMAAPEAETSPLRQGNRQVSGPTQQMYPPAPPTEFQKFVASTTGQLLPIFGENLFQNVPSTFSPDDLAPATSDYIVGPDDELRIRMWGQINYSGNVRVDRSGSIYLPQVGSVQVAGLHFAELDKNLRVAVGRIFRNFDLSVELGRIRSMQVYVTGQARRPGVYTVSSLSTLVNALFASGGPSPQGSLRHILVSRDGKTVADFDLYALLVRGDKSKDVRLMPEDVLNIPPVGMQVAVVGSVHNPGIYEMRAGETIGSLLDAAGRTTAISSNARVSLERTGQEKLRQAVEFPFDATGLATPLADGDILRIHSIVPAYEKTVTLRGNVANPGRFGWHEGMHLSDLIPDRESLVSRDYWWKRSHLGLPAPEFEAAISALGEERRPAGASDRGLNPSAPQQTAQQTTEQALTSALTQPSQTGNEQQGGVAGSSGTIGSQLTQLRASGPGGLGQVKENEVHLAAPDINWDYAVIERLDAGTLKTSLVSFDLGKLVLNHDASQDLLLQAGDTITIFSQADIVVPLDQQTKYVDLEGEFVRSGIYSVQPGETLRDLVRRAGGLTTRAYLYGSDFTRESTRVLQQQRLDEYVREVSAESARGTQALAVSGTSSAGAASDVTASRTAGQELTARLSQIRATGRIVLQFQPSNSNVDDIPAITLENGDKFVVPFAPSMINVVGAVNDQNSFLYQPSRTVGQYLKLAGGTNRNADWRHAFLIRADGSVVGRAGNNGSTLWSGKGSFTEIRLNPGDTIVVPDKTLRPTAIRNVLDWTQVFSQLALGAAAINVL
jgi:protein involved in polysaccharide export with SLBB domain